MPIDPPMILEFEKLAGDLNLVTWEIIFEAGPNDYSDSIMIRNTLLTRIMIRYDEDHSDNKFATINPGGQLIIDGVKFFNAKGRIIEAIIVENVDESLRINLM